MLLAVYVSVLGSFVGPLSILSSVSFMSVIICLAIIAVIAACLFFRLSRLHLVDKLVAFDLADLDMTAFTWPTWLGLWTWPLLDLAVSDLVALVRGDVVDLLVGLVLGVG